MAALETALALADLAPDRTDVTVIAPNTEFVYRPMVVREPFAYGSAQRYPDLSLRSYGRQRTLLSYEARTQATDEAARGAFLRY